MFWIAASPIVVAFWIRRQVTESPVWLLQGQNQTNAASHGGITRIFRRDLIATTLQTAIIMSIFMFSYYSMTFWYPTFIRELKLSPLRFLVALNLGGILGMAMCGRISETPLGRRGTVSLAALGVLITIPLFLNSSHHWMLAGAFLMGLLGIGLWGIAPLYLAERFPTEARAAGSGFAYHAGAAIGSFAPMFIGRLQDAGFTLVRSMSVCIAITTACVACIVWIGPETRGRSLVN
jgi:MFS transporter, putative metabolite:H+ symporter